MYIIYFSVNAQIHKEKSISIIFIHPRQKYI